MGPFCPGKRGVKISVGFVPEYSIGNKLSLAQLMAWHQTGTSHYWNQWWLSSQMLICITSLNELVLLTLFSVDMCVQFILLTSQGGACDNRAVWEKNFVLLTLDLQSIIRHCTIASFHMQHLNDNSKVSYGHDDVIKWKHFPHYWPFVWGIHRSSVNSPHKGQWRRALMFSLICVGINGWVNNREAGDLRCHHAHYDITVMCFGEVSIW